MLTILLYKLTEAEEGLDLLAAALYKLYGNNSISYSTKMNGCAIGFFSI